MIPTTKPKQRRYVHDLMVDVHAGRLSQAEIILRLHVLLMQLSNRSGKRAAQVSQPMTDAVRAQIRAMSAADPDQAHQSIADALGINIGRVSEVLAGKRV